MESVLFHLHEKLKLTEDEKQEVKVGEEEILLSVEKRRQCIAFSVISDHEVNIGALKFTMIKAWQVEGKAVIREIGRNKFLLELKRFDDKVRILNCRPWSFDKQLVCLQDCEEVDSLKDLLFQEEAFWIQCHDLPFAGMNQRTGNEIGTSLGKVLNVDTDSSGICLGEFLRIKVMIDITKPISRGRILNIGGTKYWIPFKYERLPNFCYHCGLFKHQSSRCEVKEKGFAIGEGLEQQYGEWLRAYGKKPKAFHSQAGSNQDQVDRPILSRRKSFENPDSLANVTPVPNTDIPGSLAAGTSKNHRNFSGDSAEKRSGSDPIPSQTPSQDKTQLATYTSPKQQLCIGSLGQTKKWKKRARVGQASIKAGFEGKSGVIVAQKRKEAGVDEFMTGKRSKFLNEDGKELEMIQAVE